MARAEEQLRKDIDTERERLASALDELRGSIADAADIGGKLRSKLPLAAGGAFGRKKADQYTIVPGNYSMFNVGGGLIVALKKRLTLRGDARQYVIYNANHTQRIQEFSGALSVYF